MNILLLDDFHKLQDRCFFSIFKGVIPLYYGPTSTSVRTKNPIVMIYIVTWRVFDYAFCACVTVSGKHQCVTYANRWHRSISAILYTYNIEYHLSKKCNLFILKLISTDNLLYNFSFFMKGNTYKKSSQLITCIDNL